MEKKIEIRKFKAFFKQQSLRYLKRPETALEFPSPKLFFKSPYYLENKIEFDALSERYAAKIKAAKTAPLYIAACTESGYGLFADAAIKKDDFIAQYSGIIEEAKDEAKQIDGKWTTDYAWDYPDAVPGFPPLQINAFSAGNISRFINHSFEPNVLVEHCLLDDGWCIFFIAARDIKKDEQIFADYGDDYWTSEAREYSIL